MSMRKIEEIQMLREVAKRLGQHSYCGPWLASIADEVEQQVRSDFFPTPSIAATRKDCEEMIALAKEKAEQIEADARTNADRMIRATEDRINSIRNRAAIAIRRVNEAVMLELEGRL